MSATNRSETSGYFAVKDAPLDPITGLDQLFREDNHPTKANLVVGVYQDDDGDSPVLDVVKEAERILLREEASKAYLPVPGEAAYRQLSETLAFSSSHPVIAEQRISSMHTPGGTGALRLAAEFLFDHAPDATIWISNPAYPNHPGIFQDAGFKTRSYRYYEIEAGALVFDGMMQDLEKAKSGDVVILHACCHNPSGADLSLDQWRQIGALVRDKRLFPLVDFAYLGFAEGIDNDPLGLRVFFKYAPCGLVAMSYSKNFALYGERTGLLSFIGVNTDHAERSAARSKVYVRRLYSSPPARGGRIVSTVLGNADLRNAWETEVNAMRHRLSDMRNVLAEKLASHQVDLSIFPYLTANKGMFALTRLTPDHVEALRADHHIYMLPNGRISIAGMTTATVDPIAAAFAGVLNL